MSLLDVVKQLQQQGMQEPAIIQTLQEQGLNPKDINDAINQSQIKAAVQEQDQQQQEQFADMQPSISQQIEAPQPQQQYQQEYPQQDYNQQQGYSQQYTYDAYQPPMQGASPEMITEIADQIVSEKLAELKRNIDKIIEFKSLSESKISQIDDRLKRIESIIDKMQMEILNRVGNLGQSLHNIKGEMEMMQDSFGKVVNPLVDRARIAEKHSGKKEGKKGKQNFEDFLR